MELSYAEFTSDRPMKKGKTVMCVPFAFKIYDKDGRKVAVPTRPKVLSAGISKSGYLMFCDEAEAMECLENLELEFRKNGISNFKDIKKASLLSKDLLRHAGFAKKAGATRDEVKGAILLTLMTVGINGVADALTVALDSYDKTEA